MRSSGLATGDAGGEAGASSAAAVLRERAAALAVVKVRRDIMMWPFRT
jgi:hypothetical protein